MISALGVFFLMTVGQPIIWRPMPFVPSSVKLQDESAYFSEPLPLIFKLDPAVSLEDQLVPMLSLDFEKIETQRYGADFITQAICQERMNELLPLFVKPETKRIATFALKFYYMRGGDALIDLNRFFYTNLFQMYQDRTIEERQDLNFRDVVMDLPVEKQIEFCQFVMESSIDSQTYKRLMMDETFHQYMSDLLQGPLALKYLKIFSRQMMVIDTTIWDTGIGNRLRWSWWGTRVSTEVYDEIQFEFGVMRQAIENPDARILAEAVVNHEDKEKQATTIAAALLHKEEMFRYRLAEKFFQDDVADEVADLVLQKLTSLQALTERDDLLFHRKVVTSEGIKIIREWLSKSRDPHSRSIYFAIPQWKESALPLLYDISSYFEGDANLNSDREKAIAELSVYLDLQNNAANFLQDVKKTESWLRTLSGSSAYHEKTARELLFLLSTKDKAAVINLNEHRKLLRYVIAYYLNHFQKLPKSFYPELFSRAQYIYELPPDAETDGVLLRLLQELKMAEPSFTERIEAMIKEMN
jgi:hypothetical protein